MQKNILRSWIGLRRKIVVYKIEPLEIVFNDKTFLCTLNNDALMLFTEMYGDISSVLENEKNRPYDFAAKVLFCGINVNQKDFKFEDAEAIIISGGVNIVAEIFDCLAESFLTNATEEQKKAYLGELERLLKIVK